MRQMIASYHVPNEEEGDAIGDAIAAPLSYRLLDVLPVARKKGSVGLAQVYEVQVGTSSPIVYRFTWQHMLVKGSYNFVYQGTITERRLPVMPGAAGRMPLTIINARKLTEESMEPVVVRVTAEPDTDLRVYLLENVINALLFALPETRSLVIPIRFAFKLPQNNNQVHRLGVVLNDPGHGHLGKWLEDKYDEHKRAGAAMDIEMFSMLSTLAHMIYQAQRAVQLQHRDLKCDNILWSPTEVGQVTLRIDESDMVLVYPTRGVTCKIIDFGMARLVYKGEYIGCDCMGNQVAFNPANDLQNFCATLIEDYAQELLAMAPKFYRWLSQLCSPIFAHTQQLSYPHNYETMTTKQRHRCLSKAVNELKLQPFVPSSMLTILKEYW